MVYADETLWPKIWLANADVIEEPSDVTSGMQLVIPPQAPLTPVERAAGEGPEPPADAPQEPGGPADGTQDAGDELEGGTRSHVISPSDANLTDLARTYYGNGAYRWKIWLANLDVLPNPDRLVRGAMLVIPPEGPYTESERRAIEAYQAGDLDAVRAIMAGSTPDTERDETLAPAEEPRTEDPQAGVPDTEEPSADVPETDVAAAEAPQASPEAGVEARIHRVAPGDVSLMGLARRYYDDSSLWPKIWVANRGELPRPEALEIGMELEIPAEAPLTAEERAALETYYQNR